MALSIVSVCPHMSRVTDFFFGWMAGWADFFLSKCIVKVHMCLCVPGSYAGKSFLTGWDTSDHLSQGHLQHRGRFRLSDLSVRVLAAPQLGPTNLTFVGICLFVPISKVVSKTLLGIFLLQDL